MYTSTAISADFTVIRGKNERLKYPSEFGVVAAIDNKSYKYTLIAPLYLSRQYRKAKLKQFNLYYAIPLSDKKLKEFIDKLDDSISKWDKKFPTNKGYNVFYSIIGKETKMFFHFQNGEDGALAYIQILTGKKFVYTNAPNSNIYETIYDFEIKSLKELKGFKELLVSALNETNLGYKENEIPSYKHRGNI